MMSAARRSTAVVAVVCGLALLAGCVNNDADNGLDADPQTFPDEGPRWVMVTTPEGFTEADAGDVPAGWVPLGLHEDGCTLAGRGVQLDETVEDPRTASEAALAAMLDEEGAETTDTREVDMTIEERIGATEDWMMRFLVAEGQADDGEQVLLAARTAIAEQLELRLGCPDPIEADMWAEVHDGLRAHIDPFGTSADDPWGHDFVP